MAEAVRDNRGFWISVALAVLLLLSLLWTWTLGNNLSEVDRKSQDLQARLAEIVPADRLDAIEKRQAELEVRIAALGDGAVLADLDKRQTDLEARFAALALPDLGPVQQQVDALKTEIADLETRFADFSVPGLDDLTSRIAAVETSVRDLGTIDVAEIDTALTGLRTDLDALRGQLGDFAPAGVEQLGGRVETLAQQLAATDERLTALEGTVAAIAVPDLAPLETRLTQMAAELAALRTGVDGAATSTAVAALDTRVTELAGQVNDSGTALTGVRDETAGLATQIDALSATLATKADSAEVEALSTRLDGLKAEIDALPTADPAAAAAEMASLRADLDTLKADVAALPRAEDLAALRSEMQGIADNPPAVRPPQVLERIYFGSSSTAVSDEERAKLAAVAQRLAASPATLELVGFSDSQGPAELNRALSLRRAAAVRLALLDAGVEPAAVTSVVGLGEDAPPVDAGDDADEAGNRVVLIYIRM